MAKKKKVESEEDFEDDFEDLDEEEFENVYPETEKKSSKESKDIEKSQIAAPEEEEEFEEFEYELEEEIEIPEYKYLDLSLSKSISENDYELQIEGQSHGFCNIFVKHLLTIEGVNIAAYKYTRIAPAKIFIRLDPGFKIKEILYKGIEALRDEVINVQKAFKKLT
jgi:DNA-directed RNA polymerase subunit L